MRSAPRDPRHGRRAVALSPELGRRLYEIGRALNLSINDVLVAIGRGRRAENAAASSTPPDHPEHSAT